MTGTNIAQRQTRWDRFLYWSNRFHQWEEFDRIEREYKIVVVSRLEQAKSEVFKSDPSWIEKLNYAITAPPNNLTNWRATQPYLAWCRSEPDNASLALRLLWDEDATVAERFDRHHAGYG